MGEHPWDTFVKDMRRADQPGEWVKLIRKLRWICLEEETRCLQMALSTLPPHERGSVLAEVFNTD